MHLIQFFDDKGNRAVGVTRNGQTSRVNGVGTVYELVQTALKSGTGLAAAIDAAGIGCEPASAASVAGVAKLRRNGTISPDAQVVAVLTGHLLKDPGMVEKMHTSTGLISRPNHPIPVSATLSAIRQALDS